MSKASDVENKRDEGLTKREEAAVMLRDGRSQWYMSSSISRQERSPFTALTSRTACLQRDS